MRRTSWAVPAVIAVVLSGCITLRKGFGPISATGVLITEDGNAYMAELPCIKSKITAFQLSYQPAAAYDVLAREAAQVALRYEFDPPVEASRAFGPIDPTKTIAGAELVQFDQEAYDLVMNTTSGLVLAGEATVPVGVVRAEFVSSDGEQSSDEASWFADEVEPTTWVGSEYDGPGVIFYDCGDEPGWDLSPIDE